MSNPFFCTRVIAFCLLSMLIHSLLGLGWWYQSQQEQLKAKQADSLTISLGLQAAMAGAQQSMARPASQATKAQLEKVIKKQQPQPIVEPETLADIDIVKNSVPVEQKRKLKPKTEPKTKTQPIKERKPKTKPKPIKQPQSKPQVIEKQMRPVKAQAKISTQQASIAGQHGVDGSNQENVKQTETGISTVSGSSLEEQFDRYIRLHLLSKKKSPKVLRSHKQQGDVTVVFTLNRDGTLLNSKITNASMIRAFDRAAIKLVRQASPYPAAPESVSWQQRRFSIQLHYQTK